MGRIKSLMVKRAAKQILEGRPDSFSPEFNKNKKILGNNLPSKPIRNKVAGYISRIVRRKNSPQKEKKVIQENIEEKPQYMQY